MYTVDIVMSVLLSLFFSLSFDVTSIALVDVLLPFSGFGGDFGVQGFSLAV